MTRDWRDDVIEALADSEAQLRAQFEAQREATEFWRLVANGLLDLSAQQRGAFVGLCEQARRLEWENRARCGLPVPPFIETRKSGPFRQLTAEEWAALADAAEQQRFDDLAAALTANATLGDLAA